MKNQGFTLIELLVVTSVIILLSTFLILYSRAGESQIILFKEQARVISTLNRAKSLSTQMFNAPAPPCAFGVNFSPDGTFLIFRDLTLTSDCRDSDNKYSVSDELFENEKYQLDPRIKFKELGLTDVIFIPPDPKTRIDNDPDKGEPGNEAIIILQTFDENTSLKVMINNAGQITIQ